MATNQPKPFNLATVTDANETRDKRGINSYGALLLPFEVINEAVLNTPSVTNNFKGKLTSALKNAPNAIKNKITHPIQTLTDLAKYMKDNRYQISGLMNTIGSKFSGIAITQAVINGKITSKEALDYLFMGFAPALGIQGSLMGYSGLNQLKDALFNGSVDVGSFINGFTRTLKGVTDLKDMLANKQNQKGKEVIEFDLTISHNETYQSETPDRRVQSGQSLNEYIHNMPETIDVQCALQDGRRYSKAEFRAILKYLRERKETVQLVLGDEIFDSLVLTNFNPSHDCTRSGMDYSLSFKKIYRNDITTTEVIIQKVPIAMTDENGNISVGTSKNYNTGSLKSLTSGNSGNVQMPDIQNPDLMKDVAKNVKDIVKAHKGESWLYAIFRENRWL